MKNVNTIKICFISPKAYPLFNTRIKPNYGGAEVQLSLIGKELSKFRDLEIHFIVADYGQEDVEDYNGIKFWKSFDFKEGTIRRILRFVVTFRKVNADIYVQRALHPVSGALALYCWIFRKKFIYMVAADIETDGNHWMYKNRVGNFLTHQNFTKSSLIVVQNEYECNNLKKRFGKINMKILKKGVQLNHLEKSMEKKYDCIWIGRCEEMKRPEIFLKLAKSNQNHNFIMICPVAKDKRDYFMSVRNEAKKIVNCKFLDFVKYEEIGSYLEQSKIHCITSEQEGDWPMTVIEACASRIPILSLKLNFGDLINEYQGGFYCYNRFEKFDEYFKLLLKDDDLYQRMSENAFKYVEKNHNIISNTKKFYKLIRGL